MSTQPPPQEQKQDPRTRRDKVPTDPGFIQGLMHRVELIALLMKDRRVHPLLKLLPIGTVVYLLIPDIPGPLDDAAVIFVGNTLFLALCPKEVVAEHLAEIEGTDKEDVTDQEGRQG